MQLVSTHPVIRSWSVDSSAVALAQIHVNGSGRHVLTAQQNILEVKCGPPGEASFQLYGHNGRLGANANGSQELAAGGRNDAVAIALAARRLPRK
jgi:hypothetical protein